MSEQPGRSESADQPPRSDRSRGGQRPPADRDTDLIGDLQRWLIRSSAKNMRRELEGQVRRTLGGQRQDKADVWDVATTEIPPEVGAAPECQWCPICRAARRMRDSGPGVAGQLSGAGEAVATAVQDALGALDSLLARTGGRNSGSADSAVADGADVSDLHADAGGPAEPAGEQRNQAAGPPAGDAADPWAGATDPEPGVEGTDPGSTEHGSGGGGHGPSDRR
jgi:hypothetical protein